MTSRFKAGEWWHTLTPAWRRQSPKRERARRIRQMLRDDARRRQRFIRFADHIRNDSDNRMTVELPAGMWGLSRRLHFVERVEVLA